MGSVAAEDKGVEGGDESETPLGTVMNLEPSLLVYFEVPLGDAGGIMAGLWLVVGIVNEFTEGEEARSKSSRGIADGRAVGRREGVEGEVISNVSGDLVWRETNVVSAQIQKGHAQRNNCRTSRRVVESRVVRQTWLRIAVWGGREKVGGLKSSHPAKRGTHPQGFLLGQRRRQYKEGDKRQRARIVAGGNGKIKNKQSRTLAGWKTSANISIIRRNFWWSDCKRTGGNGIGHL